MPRRSHLPVIPALVVLSGVIRTAAAQGRSDTTSGGFAWPPDTLVSILNVATGTPLTLPELVRRLAETDFALLGEVHDNPVHHQLRAALLASLTRGRAAVVFEQFPETSDPIPWPAAGGEWERWLDEQGFDRTSWRWPLHRPVLEAALRYGRALWGSGMSRQRLRPVVREGGSAAPEHLRTLLDQTPLDSTARAAIDHELVEGHCGQLAPEMVPGMRSAQAVRDAAMALALLRAGREGPAWLISGNGHVRRDIGVPRFLSTAAPGSAVLVVGVLERDKDGSSPEGDAWRGYDIVVVTPRAERPDPCAR